MVFSDSSGKQGLIEDISFLLGAMDLNTYTLADRTRNINEWYRKVWAKVFQSYGGWIFYDNNSNVTTPYADQTLTSGTGTYTLPTGALTVNMVEVKNSNGTFLMPLRPLTQEQFRDLGGDVRLSSNAVPLYYMLFGNTIQLVPTPNYTLANGLRVYFEQDISTFVVSDTTKVPGFDQKFHRALSLGAALDFAMIRQPNKVPTLLNALQWYMGTDDGRISGAIADWYSDRFKDNLPKKS